MDAPRLGINQWANGCETGNGSLRKMRDSTDSDFHKVEPADGPTRVKLAGCARRARSLQHSKQRVPATRCRGGMTLRRH
jgi:hypothetical protein